MANPKNTKYHSTSRQENHSFPKIEKTNNCMIKQSIVSETQMLKIKQKKNDFIYYEKNQFFFILSFN